LLFVVFASEEEGAEGGRHYSLLGSGVLVGGILDGTADHFPPRLEAGFGGRLLARTAARITEQNGEECGEDLASVRFGPGEGVGVFEVAVFGVGPGYGEADNQRARCHIATWPDIVPSEDVDGAAEDEAVLGGAEDTIAVEFFVRAFSMCGQEIVEPRAILSQVSIGTPALK